MYKTVQRVKAIPGEQIFICRRYSRRYIEENSLYEMSRSIDKVGLLQPILVRRVGARFEVISGERRYRAALISGMKRIPCLILPVDEEKASVINLSDNLHYRKPDAFEVSDELGQILGRYRLTAKEMACRLGVGISWVEEKLKLLKLDRKLVAELRKNNLGEEHARAIMRLKDIRLQKKVLEHITEEGLNAVQTEGYVKWVSDAASNPLSPSQKRRIYVIKDIRVFLNTVNRAVEVMQESGVAVETERSEDAENLLLTVKIPKSVELAGKTSHRQNLSTEGLA